MLRAMAILGVGLAVLALQAGAINREGLPRGLRNHNPGNLRYSAANDWRGQLGSDAGGYVIFDTDANGLRALAILLRNYQSRYGISTLRALVARYAPSGDGNNEHAYVAHLSSILGIGADEPVDFAAILPELMAGIVAHENGYNPYSLAMINDAVARA